MANCQFDSFPAVCTDCRDSLREWIFRNDIAFQSGIFSVRVLDSGDPADVYKSILHFKNACWEKSQTLELHPLDAGCVIASPNDA